LFDKCAGLRGGVGFPDLETEVPGEDVEAAWEGPKFGGIRSGYQKYVAGGRSEDFSPYPIPDLKR
jgi:hypothetical protein